MPLSQSSTAPRHIPALDGVRGIAAATVFVLHYGGGAQSTFAPIRILGEALHLGWAGVSLFFVLSGFLITGILWDGFRQEHWWRNFYARRSLRIFPLYYLSLLLALLFALTIDAGQHNLSSLLVYALYLQNFPTLMAHVVQFAHIVLGHFWSLAVEEQFYLIWPFLLFAIYRKSPRHAINLCVLGWLLSLAFRTTVVLLHLHQDWAENFLAGRSGELFAGAFLAMLIRGPVQQKDAILRRVPLCFWGSCLALGLLIYLSGETTTEKGSWMVTIGLSLFSMLFASIVALCLRPGLVRTFFENPFLRWLGKISYGIYVYHVLFRMQYTWVADHLAPHASRIAKLMVLFFVAGAGTLLIASLSFYTYESAFLRLKDRFSSSHRERAAVASQV